MDSSTDYSRIAREAARYQVELTELKERAENSTAARMVAEEELQRLKTSRTRCVIAGIVIIVFMCSVALSRPLSESSVELFYSYGFFEQIILFLMIAAILIIVTLCFFCIPFGVYTTMSWFRRFLVNCGFVFVRVGVLIFAAYLSLFASIVTGIPSLFVLNRKIKKADTKVKRMRQWERDSHQTYQAY